MVLKKAVKPVKKSIKKKAVLKKDAEKDRRRGKPIIWVLLAFMAVLTISASLRLMQPDWYSHRQFHPDERWIVSSAVPQIKHWGDKPIGLQYGSLPLYILSYHHRISGWMHSKGMIKDLGAARIGGARVISGIVDTLTIAAIFLTALILFGPKTALLASVLLGFTVLHIHAAHFYTVDTFVAFFMALTVYFSARIYKKGTAVNYIFAGIFFGMALASKTAAIPAVFAIITAHILNVISIKGRTRAVKDKRINAWIMFVISILAAGLVFFICMPHAVLNYEKFVKDQNYQRKILITGEGDVPYNRQYQETTPYIYQIKNMVLYTMGIPYGSAAFFALFFYILMMIMTVRKGKLPDKEILIILAWLIPYFLIVGQSFAKFNRYMIPVTPFLALLTAKFLIDFYGFVKRRFWGHTLAAVVLLGAVFYGIAFTNIYREPHAWIKASEWIYKNVPVMNERAEPARKTTILNEMWGDDLPTHAKGGHPGMYHNIKWALQEHEFNEGQRNRKLHELSEKLSGSDYVVMADKRAKGTYRRLPGKYPINYFYYTTMLNEPEKLGFEPAFNYTSYPSLFGITIKDDKADESFKLYDHPNVHIFRNTDYFEAEKLREIIARGAMEIKEKYGAEKIGADNPNIGTAKDNVVRILPDLSVFMWYILIQLFALMIFPLHFKLFGNFLDKGYGLAKITGVFLFAWVNWIFVSFNIWNFKQVNLWVLLVLLFAGSAFYVYKNRGMFTGFCASQRKHILYTETLFLGAYMLFIAVKIWCPDIHNVAGHGYGGGGEPMGMAYLSGIFNDVKFPPHDPWMSGYTLNYYYWGQLMLATAAKTAGIMPNIAYNLSLAMLFALAFIAAFTMGYNLTGKYKYGIFSGFLLAMAGNFHTFIFVFDKLANANALKQFFSGIWRFQFIWDPTRIYPHPAITEMPFFSYLYGDLHAHNIVIPVTVAAVAVLYNVMISANKGISLFGSMGETRRSAFLCGVFLALLLGSMSTINTWSLPPVAVLYIMALFTASLLLFRNIKFGKKAGIGDRAFEASKLLWRPALLLAAVGGAAYLMFYPFHADFHSPYKAAAKFISASERASLFEMYKYFSVFFLIISAYVLFVWRGGYDSFARATGFMKIKKYDPVKISRNFNRSIEKMFELPGETIRVTAALMAVIIAAVLSLAVQPTFGPLFIMIVTAAWMMFKADNRSTKFSLLLVFVSLCVVLGTELLFVADGRMNTVFKFYMTAWIFLALGVPRLLCDLTAEYKKIFNGSAADRFMYWGAGLLIFAVMGVLYFTESSSGKPVMQNTYIAVVSLAALPLIIFRNRAGKILFAGALIFILIPAVMYPVLGSLIKMDICSRGFKQEPRIDGIKYMEDLEQRRSSREDFDRYDYMTIKWINEKFPVIEPILEAPGDRMYSGLSRISIFTGNPTLAGWGYQVGQQSGRGSLVNKRIRDAKRVYTTDSTETALNILAEYGIKYVYVGTIEKRLFPANLDKFNEMGNTAYSSSGAAIYKIDIPEK